ncbi:MAG: hypothetical protein ACHQ53_05620, partial [Polyangiales bacterium]
MRARLRRAGELTLVVYGLRTAVALILVWPLFGALLRALAAPQDLGPRRAAATTLAQVLTLRGPDLALSVATTLGTQAVVAPLLTMAWLHAMAGAGSLRSCLSRATRSYPSALALALLELLLAAAACGLVGAVFVLAIDASASEMVENALRALAFTTVALTALCVATHYDLSCAELANGARGPWHAARAGLRRIRVKSLLLRGAAALFVLGLLVLAEALGRTVPASGQELLVLVPQQLLVFG